MDPEESHQYGSGSPGGWVQQQGEQRHGHGHLVERLLQWGHGHVLKMVGRLLGADGPLGTDRIQWKGWHMPHRTMGWKGIWQMV